ncbi:MAG: GNAT family N-acetyltransferase [Marinilabiliales bacterium]|nr:MAG: GNAT family N-acetyltransferase [Marinilabiliales bacterium]
MIGENVLLRAVEPADTERLYLWENDMQLWHLSNTTAPFSKYLMEQYVMNAQQDIYAAKQLRLMVDTNDEEGLTVGCIDLFDFDPANRRAGIGILISEEARGKGYGKEALELMIEYAFNTLNLHQLFCNILENNEQSIAMFKKAGFTEVGLKRDWTMVDGVWQNEFLFQLMKREKLA